MENKRIMNDYRTLTVDQHDGTAILTLNRPDVLNAIDEQMTTELRDALKTLSKDDGVRCVGLTGAGRAFSAGQDLKDVGPGISFGDSLKQRYNPVINLIARMEKPVVAIINGVAAGAGMSLALACDFRVMSSSARLIQAFVRIGLVPDSGSSYFLPRLVGRARAFELAALGDDVAADTALALGLVNMVFPDASFPVESRNVLERFANGPTRAYALIKRSLNHSGSASLEGSLDYEAYMQEIAGRTEDAKEGVKAFVERRAPLFKGK